MAEDNLCILQQKLNNLIKIQMQTFDDALRSSDSRDAARGFFGPMNTYEKAQMSCERIQLLSKEMISILHELSDKGVYVIISSNKEITIDTVVTHLYKEVERLKTKLFKNKLSNLDSYKKTFDANALMIDNTFEDVKNMIITEIDIITRAINSPSTISHNTVIANTITNSPIQQGGAHSSMTQSANFNQDNLDDLRRLVDLFDKHLDDLAMEAAARRKAAAQVATIKAQLEDEPDPMIVMQAGRTLRNITEGAIGSLIATAAQPTVWTMATSILEKLFGGS